MDQTHRYWFAAKRYGWGWGPPVTWQGWVVTIVWLGAMLLGLWVIGVRWHPVACAGFALGMTCVLLFICYRKGEPPRWRWGDDT
jgi:hypothetical protein